MNVVVEFFGAFTVMFKKKNEKQLCCLFTCLTMRAVPIVVVHMLNTDSCLNVTLRFIARSGKL